MVSSRKDETLSKPVSVRLRRDLLERLQKEAEARNIPWQTYWQNLTQWALVEAEAGRASVPADLGKKPLRGRPRKEEPASIPPPEPPLTPKVEPSPPKKSFGEDEELDLSDLLAQI